MPGIVISPLKFIREQIHAMKSLDEIRDVIGILEIMIAPFENKKIWELTDEEEQMVKEYECLVSFMQSTLP